MKWSKIWSWVKLIAFIFGVGGVAFLVHKGRKAIKGKVKREDTFWVIPGNDKQIRVLNKKTGKPERVNLPKGVKPRKVRAVEIVSDTKIVVEVIHEKVDRRNVKSIDDSALSRIKSKS